MAYIRSAFVLALVLAVAYAANEDYPLFFLQNLGTGKCMDVSGVPGVANSANIQLSACEFDWDWRKTDQIFGLQNNGFLVSRASLKCLDIVGMKSKAGGTNLVLFPCSENDDHHWEFDFKDANSEAFRIKSKDTGLCVDAVGQSASTALVNLQETTCEAWGAYSGKTDHWYRMVPATQPMPKFFYIRGFVTKNCIDVSGAPGVASGSNVQSWACENSGDNQFKSDQLWYVDNGKIWNRVSGLCIVVAGSNTNGANINLGSCDSATSNWQVEKHPSVAGVYRFRNRNTNRCLEVIGRNNKGNGVNIQQYDCQAWNFPDDHRWTLALGPLNRFFGDSAAGLC